MCSECYRLGRQCPTCRANVERMNMRRMDVDREIRAANRRIQAQIDEMAAEAWERLGYTREQQEADRRRAMFEGLRMGIQTLGQAAAAYGAVLGGLSDAIQTVAAEAIEPFAAALAATRKTYPTPEETTHARRDRH